MDLTTCKAQSSMGMWQGANPLGQTSFLLIATKTGENLHTAVGAIARQQYWFHTSVLPRALIGTLPYAQGQHKCWAPGPHCWSNSIAKALCKRHLKVNSRCWAACPHNCEQPRCMAECKWAASGPLKVSTTLGGWSPLLRCCKQRQCNAQCERHLKVNDQFWAACRHNDKQPPRNADRRPR